MPKHNFFETTNDRNLHEKVEYQSRTPIASYAYLGDIGPPIKTASKSNLQITLPIIRQMKIAFGKLRGQTIPNLVYHFPILILNILISAKKIFFKFKMVTGTILQLLVDIVAELKMVQLHLPKLLHFQIRLISNSIQIGIY